MTPTPPPELQDLINHNTALRRAVVQGLEAAIYEMGRVNQEDKSPRGRHPRLGNEAQDVRPRRFYVQLEYSDLRAIVLPPEMKNLLMNKLNMKPTRSVPQPRGSVPIRWSKCCQYFVQVQWFQQDIVIFAGWREFVRARELEMGDVVVFKYNDGGFDINVFKHGTSTEKVFQCEFHPMA